MRVFRREPFNAAYAPIVNLICLQCFTIKLYHNSFEILHSVFPFTTLVLQTLDPESKPIAICYICVSETNVTLSTLRLLVPPLRLLSAAMWQLAKQKDVMNYEKLQEFVFMVTEAVPGLISNIQRAQLILGLRARVRINFSFLYVIQDWKHILAHTYQYFN